MKEINRRVLLVQCFYFLWLLLVIGTIGTVYFGVTHDGIVDRFPDLGQKVSKLPFGFGLLKKSPSFAKLDYGHVISMWLLVGVVLSWEHTLLYFVKPDS